MLVCIQLSFIADLLVQWHRRHESLANKENKL